MSYPEMAKTGVYKFITDNGRCLEVLINLGDGYSPLSVSTGKCFRCGGDLTCDDGWTSCHVCPEPQGEEHGGCIYCGTTLDYFYNCPICSLPAKQAFYNKCYPTGGK